jgi:hypothetical protein
LWRFDEERREKDKMDERGRYEGNDTMLIYTGHFPLVLIHMYDDKT